MLAFLLQDERVTALDELKTVELQHKRLKVYVVSPPLCFSLALLHFTLYLDTFHQIFSGHITIASLPPRHP